MGNLESVRKLVFLEEATYQTDNSNIFEHYLMDIDFARLVEAHPDKNYWSHKETHTIDEGENKIDLQLSHSVRKIVNSEKQAVIYAVLNQEQQGIEVALYHFSVQQGCYQPCEYRPRVTLDNKNRVDSHSLYARFFCKRSSPRCSPPPYELIDRGQTNSCPPLEKRVSSIDFLRKGKRKLSVSDNGSLKCGATSNQY